MNRIERTIVWSTASFAIWSAFGVFLMVITHWNDSELLGAATSGNSAFSNQTGRNMIREDIRRVDFMGAICAALFLLIWLPILTANRALAPFAGVHFVQLLAGFLAARKLVVIATDDFP